MNSCFSSLRLWVFGSVLLLFAAAARGGVTVTPDHDDHLYAVGEEATWTLRWTGDETPPEKLRVTIKSNGYEQVSESMLAFDGEEAIQIRLEKPGTMLLEVHIDDERVATSGIVVDPDRITRSEPRPDDFDDFWDRQIERLEEIPQNVRIEPTESRWDQLDFYEIRMDGIDGSTIHGQLARPKQGEKFPAVLIVQWAGVYGLDKSWAAGPALDGWLTLNILAHDLPLYEDRDFYRDQNDGPLNNYPAIGNDSRDASYFLRMYLSCYRAAEYLTSRDDWNGEVLVVMGGSQGGMQAIVTAALHPEVDAAMASVPAGCDLNGPANGRSPGWPMWYWQTGDRDAEAVRETGRYFDVVNFASRVDVPVLVSIGLIDEVCPPAGIIAATNEMQGPVERVYLLNGAHQEVNGSHDAYDERLWEAWLPALREGRPAPVEP